MAFCKEYNAATAKMAGDIIPVEITVYEVGSFPAAPAQPAAEPCGSRARGACGPAAPPAPRWPARLRGTGSPVAPRVALGRRSSAVLLLDLNLGLRAWIVFGWAAGSMARSGVPPQL